MFHYVSFQFGLMFNGRHPFNTKTPAKFPPNDPSSATRPTRRVDCNLDAMAGFAAALVRRQISHISLGQLRWLPRWPRQKQDTNRSA